MANGSRVRNVMQVVEDLLWPGQGMNIDPEQDRRHAATAEVLCRIPESDYQKLTELVDDFLWFVPSQFCGAMVHPFPWTRKETGLKPYAVVLYLCPTMERWGFDVIVASVAHELAHLVLRHNLRPSHAQSEQQEREAWDLIRKWGFESEERKHELFYKKRGQREEAMIAALKRRRR
jgi:hypothetical protein